jgi:hypothetical protein
MKNFAIAFALALFPFTAAAEPVCLHYGDTVKLEGTVSNDWPTVPPVTVRIPNMIMSLPGTLSTF